MPPVTDRRLLSAIVALLAIGFAMVALADALDAVWPLFVTPLPYAAIPWLIARQARANAAARTDAAGAPAPND
jgi:hypothetical protein